MTTTTHGAGILRAILWKELRQNLKWGALGLVVSAAGLALALAIATAMGSLTGGASVMTISWMTAFLAPVVGLMIGFGQTSPENRGDEWSFLVHRPVSRSTLFRDKASAGLLLYLVAFGLPLTLAVRWATSPGHFAVPFDVRMLEPSIADLLCGIVYYFAAVLTVMRDGRWYGSRALGVAAAIFCSIEVVGASSFSVALAYGALGLLVLGAAAWGAFAAGGAYEPQPRAARAAAGASAAAGLWVVGLVVLGVSAFVVAVPSGLNFRSTAYAVTRDGRIVQTVTERGVVVETKDLNGRVLHRDSTAADSSQPPSAVSASLSVDTTTPNYWMRGYRSSARMFVQLPVPSANGAQAQAGTPSPPVPAFAGPVAWFYVRRLDLIAAYDTRSGGFSGWLGPDGFSAGSAPPPHHFQGPARRSSMMDVFGGAPVLPNKLQGTLLLVLPGAVYRLDLNHREAEKIFSAPTGDAVVAAASSTPDAATLVAYGARAQFEAVATQHMVYVLFSDGLAPLALPPDPKARGYGGLEVSRALDAPGAPIFLRYSPEGAAVRASADQVAEYATGGALLAHYTLPGDTANPWSPNWTQVAGAALATPLTEKIVSAVQYRGAPSASSAPLRHQRTVSWLLTILASLGSAAGAFAIGRRYAFDRRRAGLWAAIAIALGPMSILLMLALLEWPAREACPNCGRKRVVTRQRCEHCGAPFAPPALDGTEIFEAAAMAVLAEIRG